MASSLRNKICHQDAVLIPMLKSLVAAKCLSQELRVLLVASLTEVLMLMCSSVCSVLCSVLPAHLQNSIMAQSSANPTKAKLRPTNVHDDDRGTDSGYSAPSAPFSTTTTNSKAQLALSPTVPPSSTVTLAVTNTPLPVIGTTCTQGMLGSANMASPFLYPIASPMTTMVSGTSIGAHPLGAPIPNIFSLVTHPQSLSRLGPGPVILPPILPLPLQAVQPTTLQEAPKTIVQSPVTTPLLDTRSLPSPPPSTTSSSRRSSHSVQGEGSDCGTKPNQPSIAELRAFAEEFRRKRISLGYTQGAVGTSLAKMGFVNFAQSTISRFEQMQLSPRNAASIKDVLVAWMQHAEKYPQGALVSEDSLPSPTLSLPPVGVSYGTRKRKKRAVFTPSAKRVLEDTFHSDPKPNRAIIEQLSQDLDMLPEEVRVWFCNKRQKEKGGARPSTSSSVAEEETEPDVHSTSTSSSPSSACMISSVSNPPVPPAQRRGSIPQNFRIEEMSKSSSTSPASSETGSPTRNFAE